MWTHWGSGFERDLDVLAFDLDSTLRTFRKRGPPSRLTTHFLAGLSKHFNIVVFTNRKDPQASIEYVDELRARGGDCDVVCATASDRNRKPQRGGWECYSRKRGVTPDRVAFFCGDAAGRAGDFSASDRRFANNVGIAFIVPEQLFGSLMAHPTPPVSPRWSIEGPIAAAQDPELQARYADAVRRASQHRAVIMVGSPGSGKSHMARLISELGGHAIASSDDDGAGPRYLGVGMCRLREQTPVVFDATHRTKRARAKAIKAASSAESVMVVWLKTPKAMCQHLDGYRCDTKGKPKLLPPVAIHGYWKYLEPPEHDEFPISEFLAVEFAFHSSTPSADLRLRY